MRKFIIDNLSIIVLVIMLLIFFKGCGDSQRMSKMEKVLIEQDSLITEKLINQEDLFLLVSDYLEIQTKLNDLKSWLVTVGNFENSSEKERAILQIKILEGDIELIRTKYLNLKEKYDILEKENKELKENITNEELAK